VKAGQSAFELTALAGSERSPPGGKRLRRVAAGTRLELSLYLRAREGARSADEAQPGEPGFRPLDRDELAREREALHQGDVALIEKWTAAEGLAVTRRDPARRLVKVAGSVEQIERALSLRLHNYRDGDERFRGRSGGVHLPNEIAQVVEGVFGLDTRPVAESQLGVLGLRGPRGGHLPSQFAQLYDFPATPGLGAGQTIALLMFGGGYLDSDLDLAFAAMGHAKPVVVPEGVSGAFNNMRDTDRNKEVALDIQIAGGLAPGAKIVVYFAPNTGQGWVDAVSRAIHDLHHRPTIISISWAQSEERWTADFPDKRAQLTALFQDAARLGITVVAASGDNGAIWRSPGKARVGYPASDPFVCGCGGTMLVGPAGGVRTEAVWNRPALGAGGSPRISGGGVSGLFPVPSYQAAAVVPVHANSAARGRGIPDVSAIADALTGYRIFLSGQEVVAEGTSAATPLWAALIARINESKGRSVGFFLPRAYAAPAAFNDVATGDNRVGGVGYAARAGWDPCTGLGSPNGVKLLAIL